jgi:hypothetical protein
MLLSAATGFTPWWIPLATLVLNAPFVGLPLFGTWRALRRFAKLGYAVGIAEEWGLGPRGNGFHPFGVPNLARAARCLPARDDIALAPAFAGMDDPEMIEEAILMLFEAMTRNDARGRTSIPPSAEAGL